MYALNFMVCFSLVLLFERKYMFTVVIAFQQSLKQLVCEENNSQQGTAVDQVFAYRSWGRGEQGEGSGWGERQGRDTDQDMLSFSPGCSQIWNMALLFWSWEQCTSSPHVFFPVSPRYHWPVPMWINPLILLYHYMSNFSFFCVSPVKRLLELVFSICLLAGLYCLWVVSSSVASKSSQSESWKCSFGLKANASECVSLSLFI